MQLLMLKMLYRWRMLKKHPKPASVTFCWMQGERDANGGGQPAYKDALKLLITKLRRDLDRPDMNVVIGRLSDAGEKKESWKAMRKIQMEIAGEDPSGEGEARNQRGTRDHARGTAPAGEKWIKANPRNEW